MNVREDGMDGALDQQGRTEEELDLTVGNTMESSETWRLIIIQDITCQEGEKFLDYVAKSNKGGPQLTDAMNDPCDASADDLPSKQVQPL